MKRILCVAIVCSCVASSAFAGPIRDSAARQTPAPAAPDSKPKRMERKNSDLYWGGVVMAGVGGGMLGWGLGMGDPTASCVGIGSFVSCQETGGNRGLFIGVGAAMMGGGIVLGALGGKKVEVAPSLRGVAVRW